MAAKSHILDVLIRGRDLLSGPLRTAGSRISRFSLEAGTGFKKLSGAVMNTRNMIAGAVAVLGVKKGWDGLNEWAGAADRVGKQAFRLGMATDELQRWSRAAEMSDVPTSKFMAGLGKLNDNMGNLKVGKGALFALLKDAAPGLLKQAQATTTTTEAMDLFIRALDQTSSAQEREALARAAFGKAGGDMITMIKDSYPELRKLLDEMDSYGLVTDKAARDAETFNDAQTRLKYSIEGVKNELGSRLIPLLTPLILRTKDWIVANRGLIATKIVEYTKLLWERLAPIGRFFRDNREGIWSGLQAGGEILSTLGTGASALLKALDRMPGVARAASVAFIAAMVAMNSNPQFAALLAGAVALKALVDASEKRDQKTWNKYIDRTDPGAPIIRNKEDLDRWNAEQDAIREGAVVEGQKSYMPGYRPGDDTALWDSALHDAVMNGPKLGFSVAGMGEGGIVEIPLKLAVDPGKLPPWLGVSPHQQPNKPKVGVRLTGIEYGPNFMK